MTIKLKISDDSPENKRRMVAASGGYNVPDTTNKGSNYVKSELVHIPIAKFSQSVGGGGNVTMTQPSFFSPMHTAQNWQIPARRRELIQWSFIDNKESLQIRNDHKLTHDETLTQPMFIEVYADTVTSCGDQRVEVFGSKGCMKADNNTPTNTALTTAEGVQSDKPLYFFLERYAESFIAEIRAFGDAIINNTPSLVTGEDGMAPIVIALAAKKSMMENRPVKLSEII